MTMSYDPPLRAGRRNPVRTRPPARGSEDALHRLRPPRRDRAPRLVARGARLPGLRGRYVVIEGSLRISRILPDGHLTVLRRLDAGQVLDCEEALRGTLAVEALSDTLLVRDRTTACPRSTAPEPRSARKVKAADAKGKRSLASWILLFLASLLAGWRARIEPKRRQDAAD